MANDTAVPLNRIERILVVMFGAVAALSILGLVVTLVASLAGATLGEGVWPTIAAVPFVGFPIAFVLVAAFLVVSTVRRRRLGRDGR